MSTGSDKLQEWISSRSKNDWRALFVCILISASIWVLRSLTEDATDVFTVPVVFVDVPEGFDLISASETQLELEVTSTGFGILGQRYFQREKPLEFSLNSLPRIEGEQAIASKSLFNRARKLVGSDRDILGIQPDSLYVTMSKRAQKEVAINYIITENLASGEFLSKQFDNVNGKVMLTGPQTTLDTLNSIPSAPLTITGSGTYDVKLLIPDGLKASSSLQVQLTAEVDALGEKTFRIPISLSPEQQAENIVLYPTDAEVKVIAGKEVIEQLTVNSFKLVLANNDLSLLASAGQNKVTLVLAEQPDELQSVEVSPGRIEFYIPR